MRHSILVSAFLTLAAHAADTNAPARFDQLVKPMFTKSCMGCHNERLASGSLNLAPYTAQNSLVEGRDGWERILQKVRSGEMPPKGLPRPSVAEVKTLVDYINGEFEKADRLVKPDPGRVTARRLNRNEYSNTIRDLLAVDFRAERDFPSDDSGHGFDNIGDVLTISPILMEKYLRAAERIAARAIGADPLPKKPVDAEYHSKEKAIRRIDRSTIEATHRIDLDGEYIVRIGFPGERSADSPPVKFGFWMDGKLLHTMSVETKPSKLVYFDPYSEEEFRLVLPEGRCPRRTPIRTRRTSF
jgi:mono/diheme cytochrome c family protein